jgi:hypothetical protein
MSREKRFEQKQNARIERFKRIWRNVSNYEIAGYYLPGWHREAETPRCMEKHWKDWATGVNYCAVPGWWNRLYHTQPKRIAANRLCDAIVKGREPETVMWPAKKKPTHYYW